MVCGNVIMGLPSIYLYNKNFPLSLLTDCSCIGISWKSQNNFTVYVVNRVCVSSSMLIDLLIDYLDVLSPCGCPNTPLGLSSTPVGSRHAYCLQNTPHSAWGMSGKVSMTMQCPTPYIRNYLHSILVYYSNVFIFLLLYYLFYLIFYSFCKCMFPSTLNSLEAFQAFSTWRLFIKIAWCSFLKIMI